MFFYILLGIIQGLTEFLPISSSGHLVVFEHFFKISQNNILLEVALHVGSLFAVVIYFRKDILSLLISLFYFTKKSEKKNILFIYYLVIATITTSFFALTLKDSFLATFEKPILVSFFLVINGFILLFSDKVNKDGEFTFKIALIIGIVQAFAILPGISRSGMTITTAIFLGINRKNAAKFSFLLSIPAIIGAFILELDNFLDIKRDLFLNSIIGALFAFISGYLVIAFLLKLIQKRKLFYFSYYCFSFALISFVLISALKL